MLLRRAKRTTLAGAAVAAAALVFLIMMLLVRSRTALPASASSSFCQEKIHRAHAALTKANAKYKAMIEITPLELAMRRAKQLDDDDDDGKLLHGARKKRLHCQTVAVKDNIETSFSLWGLHTTAGSLALYRLLGRAQEENAAASAPAIQLLEQEGVVILGKSNMDDFALSYHSYSTRGGQTRSALKGKRWYPGGSSGGSAVAAALGLVDFAIGTDTGGSIRIPSAFNGIVGLRPALTSGISTRGVIPLSASRDTVGPLARDVDTVQVVFEVLRGGKKSSCAPLPSSARVGILADYFEDVSGGGGFKSAVRVLQEDMGAKLLTDYPEELSLAQLKRQSKSASMYEFKTIVEAYLANANAASSSSLTLQSLVDSTKQTCAAVAARNDVNQDSDDDEAMCQYVVDSLEKKLATAASRGTPPAHLTAKWKQMHDLLVVDLMKRHSLQAVVIPAVSVPPTRVGKKQAFCANNRLASITGLAGLAVSLSPKLPLAIEFIGTDECALFAAAREFKRVYVP